MFLTFEEKYLAAHIFLQFDTFYYHIVKSFEMRK